MKKSGIRWHIHDGLSTLSKTSNWLNWVAELACSFYSIIFPSLIMSLNEVILRFPPKLALCLSVLGCTSSIYKVLWVELDNKRPTILNAFNLTPTTRDFQTLGHERLEKQARSQNRLKNLDSGKTEANINDKKVWKVVMESVFGVT